MHSESINCRRKNVNLITRSLVRPQNKVRLYRRHGYITSHNAQANAQLNLSVRSFYYRSSKKAQLALCPRCGASSFQWTTHFLNLHSCQRCCASNKSKSRRHSKQIKRTFTALKPIFEPFNDNDLRTSKSWKCEIAAIVLAVLAK